MKSWISTSGEKVFRFFVMFRTQTAVSLRWFKVTFRFFIFTRSDTSFIKSKLLTPCRPEDDTQRFLFEKRALAWGGGTSCKPFEGPAAESRLISMTRPAHMWPDLQDEPSLSETFTWDSGGEPEPPESDVTEEHQNQPGRDDSISSYKSRAVTMEAPPTRRAPCWVMTAVPVGKFGCKEIFSCSKDYGDTFLKLISKRNHIIFCK